MRLFLIRHGETVDNVDGVYAGSRDSALTNHGVTQTQRLAAHLAASGVRVSYLFSSDLQRAARTAEAIRHAQTQHAANPDAVPRVTQLAVLREQHFGGYEGVSFHAWSISGGVVPAAPLSSEPMEAAEALTQRARAFLDDMLVPLHAAEPEACVAVVSHGLFLAELWSYLANRVLAAGGSLAAAPGVMPPDGMPLKACRRWSNTGYYEVEVTAAATPDPPANGQPSSTTDDVEFFRSALVVHALDSRTHLAGLKRTRGGIGSEKHDDKQSRLTSFFEKQ